MIFSLSLGVSSSKMAASSVPGVNIGAPLGVSWTMWTMEADAERYFSSRLLIAFAVEETFSVLRLPVLYLVAVSIALNPKDFGREIRTHSEHQ
jgi:hypothetical protein